MLNSYLLKAKRRVAEKHTIDKISPSADSLIRNNDIPLNAVGIISLMCLGSDFAFQLKQEEQGRFI